MTRYIFDPGLPGETGFYYPESWEPMDAWPSAMGLQADEWYSYVAVEDRQKLFYGVISGENKKHRTVFVNSQEELLKYMKLHDIEVEDNGTVCNNGKVYPI